MKRKVIPMILSLAILVISLASCGEVKSGAPFNGILDTDTKITYQIGDKKEKFDKDFGNPEFDADREEYLYLSGVLTVEYDENDCAAVIESSGKSNRFEFNDFTFDKPINEIEGRYEKFDEAAGYVFYSRYYDDKGKSCDLYGAVYTARLMVRDGDMELLDLKDGEYVSYSIELNSYVSEKIKREISK